MAGLHAFFFKLSNFLVHEIVTTAWDTYFLLHRLEWFVLSQLGRGFVKLLYSLSLKLSNLSLGYCCDKCFANALVWSPNQLQVTPNFT